MTLLGFYKHPEKYSSNATIQSVTNLEIVLDKTIFYPQGGGQPSDLGQNFSEDSNYIVEKAI